MIRRLRNQPILTVAGIDLLLFAGGVGVTYIHGVHRGGPAISLAAIGIVTFAGFFVATEEMRETIAATLVIVYVVLLSMALFDGDLRSYLDQSEFARSLVTQFTALVGTAVAFYLGASAIVRRTEIQEEKRDPGSASGSTDDGPTRRPPG